MNRVSKQSPQLYHTASGIRGRISEGALEMMTPESLRGYVKAEPFRPFRLHLASGRTFDVRHPEMVKILKSSVLVFKFNGETSEVTDEWESVSLMLTESASHLDVVTSHS